MALADGDPDLRNQLIELFVEESPRLLARVRTAIDGHDSRQLERTAHALKGSMMTFLAVAGTGPASRLERLGHKQEWSGVEEAFAALQQELGQLHSALTPLLTATIS